MLLGFVARIAERLSGLADATDALVARHQGFFMEVLEEALPSIVFGTAAAGLMLVLRSCFMVRRLSAEKLRAEFGNEVLTCAPAPAVIQEVSEEALVQGAGGMEPPEQGWVQPCAAVAVGPTATPEAAPIAASSSLASPTAPRSACLVIPDSPVVEPQATDSLRNRRQHSRQATPPPRFLKRVPSALPADAGDCWKDLPKDQVQEWWRDIDASPQAQGLQRPESTADALLKKLNSDDITVVKSVGGIGEKRAASIISYRREHGDLQQLSDVERISLCKRITAAQLLRSAQGSA